MNARAALLVSALFGRPYLRSLLIKVISNLVVTSLSMTPQEMNLVDPSLEMYIGDDREMPLLA